MQKLSIDSVQLWQLSGALLGLAGDEGSSQPQSVGGDVILNAIGLALAVLGIIVAVIIFHVQSRRTTLTYQVFMRSLTPSLAYNEQDNNAKGRVQLVVDGKPVEDPYQIEVKIINSSWGNNLIRKEDYDGGPITLSLGQGTQILMDPTIKTGPEEFAVPEPEIEGEKIKLKPVSLDVRDSITIWVLVGQFSGIMDDIKIVDTRILGVRIRRYTEKALPYYVRFGILSFLPLLVIFLGSGTLIFGPSYSLPLPGVLVWFLTLFGLSVIIAVLITLVSYILVRLRGPGTSGNKDNSGKAISSPRGTS